ncbi:DUF4145 domain-containing protein [Streptomyces sp. NPDC053720]|uniref:DUF4145 domain-containing protein n=1 Tax=Streptomyces sp. NPDC053720 TaxID=3154855 RepID=UPI00341E39FE
MNLDLLTSRTLGQRKAVCPHPECAAGVSMQLRDRRQVHPNPSLTLVMKTNGPVVYEELWSCDLCSRGTIELVGYDGVSLLRVEEAPEAWRRQVWPEPAPRELSSDVPEMVRILFTEASRAERGGGFRLAGVGYRAAVEEICKDQGATKYTLHDKIAELAARGLPQEVVDAMNEARVVGNDSVHHNLEYAADEIADLAEIIAEATEILYVEPANRKRMAEARKARSQAAKAK